MLKDILIWADDVRRIGRTLKGIGEIGTANKILFEEVSCSQLLRGATDGKVRWEYLLSEIEQAERFFDGFLPIRYFMPNKDYPCVLISDKMTGCVLVAPVILSGDD